MLYYYLEGLDKKGPYTADEIKARHLPEETLIFSESIGNWKTLSELSEFKGTDIPNPPSVANSVSPPEKNTNAANPDVIKKENSDPVIHQEKKRIKIPAFVLFIVFLAAFVGISYIIVYSQKKSDLKKMNAKIDEVLKGKTTISDFRKYGNSGILYDVKKDVDGMFDAIKTDKRVLVTRYSFSKENTNTSNIDLELKTWNSFKDIIQYYESESYGGFSILELSQEGSSYSITEKWSGDMAYKVPESIYHAGKDFGYGMVSEGYSTPTFRPSIGTCYEEAAKYLTVENENKSYLAGSYERISNFRYLSSKFYKFNLGGPKNVRLGNDIYIKDADGKMNKTINNYKITDATGAQDANVFTSQWIVWYRSVWNRFYLIEDTKVFKKYLLIYSAIGAVLSLIIVLIIKYRKKVSLQVS